MAWRDTIKVHSAADLFPMMSDAELDALAEDIKKNGLTHRLIFWSQPGGKLQLLDGRNRLEALERIGIQFDVDEHAAYFFPKDTVDPYAYVVSANIVRRHLTAEDKRDLIAKLLKASPKKSDRSIAKTVGVDNKTVAAVRSREEIPHVDKRTDTKGRQQPATRARRGERHVCWQCRARDEVGKVEKHHYAEYGEDCDVWLHPACVADFEKSLAADRKPADDQPTDVEASANARKSAAAIEEAPGGAPVRPVPDVQPTAAKPQAPAAPLDSLAVLQAAWDAAPDEARQLFCAAASNATELRSRLTIAAVRAQAPPSPTPAKSTKSGDAGPMPGFLDRAPKTTH